MLDITWDAMYVKAPMTCGGRYLYYDFNLGVMSGYTAPVPGGEPVVVETVYHEHARYRKRLEECENEVQLVLDRDERPRREAHEPEAAQERRRRAVAMERERSQPVSELWRTEFDDLGERCPPTAGQAFDRGCELVQKGAAEITSWRRCDWQVKRRRRRGMRWMRG